MDFCNKAGVYDEHAWVQRDLVSWGSSFLSEIFRGKKVLELGAGTGVFTEVLEGVGVEELIASDISREMIEVGRMRVPGAIWKEVDAWELLLRERVDVIASSALLQWAEDPVGVLKNWRNGLSAKGEVFALIFGEESLSELYEIEPKVKKLSFYSKKQWHRFFEEAEYVDVEWYDCVKSYEYENARAFLRGLHGTGVTSRNSLGYVGVRNLIKEYDRRYCDAGSVKANWHFICVKARVG